MSQTESANLEQPLRHQLIANAIDDVTVAQAASKGVLPTLRLLISRCKAVGVDDPTLKEIAEAWADVMG